MISRTFIPLDDQAKGGAVFATVLCNAPEYPTPHCVSHGAMNKVSEDGIWRCISTAGPKLNGCRSACMEVRT